MPKGFTLASTNKSFRSNNTIVTYTKSRLGKQMSTIPLHTHLLYWISSLQVSFVIECPARDITTVCLIMKVIPNMPLALVAKG